MPATQMHISNQLNYFRQQELLFQQQNQPPSNFGSNVNRLRSVFFTQQQQPYQTPTVQSTINQPPPIPPKHISRNYNLYENTPAPDTHQHTSRSRSLSTPRARDDPPRPEPDVTGSDHLTRFQSAKALFARMEEESSKQRQSLVTKNRAPVHYNRVYDRRSLSHTPKQNYTIITASDQTEGKRPGIYPKPAGNEISANIVSTKRLLFQTNERTDATTGTETTNSANVGFHSSSSSISSAATANQQPEQHEASPPKRSWSKLSPSPVPGSNDSSRSSSYSNNSLVSHISATPPRDDKSQSTESICEDHANDNNNYENNTEQLNGTYEVCNNHTQADEEPDDKNISLHKVINIFDYINFFCSLKSL